MNAALLTLPLLLGMPPVAPWLSFPGSDAPRVSRGARSTELFIPVLRVGGGALLGDADVVGGVFELAGGARFLARSPHVDLAIGLDGGFAYQDTLRYGETFSYLGGLTVDVVFPDALYLGVGALARAVVGFDASDAFTRGYRVGGRLSIFYGILVVEAAFQELWVGAGDERGVVVTGSVDFGSLVADLE
ncbi:MAG: hypothetical protein KF729_22260 [Sandaracinaceae bacterium]|nr:hypothetical protein [Sandaracinaceae bacterium]